MTDRPGATGRRIYPVADVTRREHVPAVRASAEISAFTADTIGVALAGVVEPVQRPDGPPLADHPLPPAFLVALHDDDRTYGLWPMLRPIMAAIDAVGGAISERIRVSTSWSVLLGGSEVEPLVKLKIDVEQPDECRSSARVLFQAGRYADVWSTIADGGLIVLTTVNRFRAATSLPDPSPADLLDRALVFGIGASPGLRELIARSGWPSR